MKKRLLLVLIVALTVLTAVGVSAPRKSAAAAAGDAACRTACNDAFDACLSYGMSFHQCLGDLHRCNKSCQ